MAGSSTPFCGSTASRVLMAGGLYSASGVAITAYNKWLLHYHQFTFPITMVMVCLLNPNTMLNLQCSAEWHHDAFAFAFERLMHCCSSRRCCQWYCAIWSSSPSCKTP